LKKRKQPKKIQERNDNSPFLSLFCDLTLLLRWLQHLFFMPVLFETLSIRIDSLRGTKRSSSPSDLIEKALRKLAGQRLRKEIDVTKAWLFTLPVSPPKDRSYSPVVTYFILGCPANF
jgi:hypothetical protein